MGGTQTNRQMGNIYKFFVGTSKGKGPQEKPRSRWEDKSQYSNGQSINCKLCECVN